jgi:hypothetical protein
MKHNGTKQNTEQYNTIKAAPTYDSKYKQVQNIVHANFINMKLENNKSDIKYTD